MPPVRGENMRKFYITFIRDSTPICGTEVEANTAGEAGAIAEYRIMCRYPNIAYDGIRVKELMI